MRIQILFLFFTCQLFCQTTSFDKLFNEFDRYDYDEVKKTLASIDENKIILYSVSDSVRFSLYNLIKFQSTAIEKLRKDSVANTNYQSHLNYLIKKGLEDYLPYFFNHYASTYAFEEAFYSSCLEYLNISIEIEKKGLNKSHVLSITNLFDAYNFKHILRNAYDDNYKDEDLKSLILHHENNNEKLNFLSNNLLFKKYYQVSESKFLDQEFRFSGLKKTFEYSAKLESLPVGYSYRNLLFYLRTSDLTDTNALIYINTNHRDAISPLNYLINECYINNYSASSFNGLKTQINTFLDRNMVLTPDEILDIKLLLSKISIKIRKEWLETKPSKPDVNFWHEVFNLGYKFNKLYGSGSDLIYAIDEILSLNTNYESDRYNIDIKSLELEKHDIIYEAILNNNSEGVSPFNFIDMYKIRSQRIYYPNWTEKEIESELLILLNTYKKTITYKNLVKTLELFWQFSSSIKNYKIEGIQTDAILNETKVFILDELNDKVSDEDLNLRILVSSLEELKTLNNTIEVLYKQKIINETRFKNLNLTVLQRKYNLENTSKSAFVYYKYILQMQTENSLRPSVAKALRK